MPDAISSRARGSVGAEAYESLRAALIKGEIAPGSSLSEPQIAEQLATSRSPVREALNRLLVEGFVTRTETGRLKAAPLDISELEDLYVLRAAIEGLAARLATPRVTMQDLDAMAGSITRMETRTAAGDVRGSLEAGAEFHAAIQARCGNAPLGETIDSVRHRIVRYRMLIAAARTSELRAAEHRAVLRAMLDRDPDRAGREMVRHVEASADAFRRSIRSASGAPTGIAGPAPGGEMSREAPDVERPDR